MTPRLLPLFSAAIIAAAFTSTATAKDFPKGSPKFFDDYSKALTAAKNAEKPLLVVFSASWCAPCQANKLNVYPSAEIKKFHDKFVWAYLDTDTKKNASVAKQFKVSGIPHIQFLTKSGENLDTVVGATSPEQFAKKLKSVLKKAAERS